MKKTIAMLIAVIMVVSLFAGCGSNAAPETAAPAPAADPQAAADAATETLRGSGKKITALFFTLEGEYFTILDTILKEKLEALGYTYESQSSNFDPVTMITQIENAVAGGSDLIWTWPLSGDIIADACAAARQKGVKVYSFIQDPGEASCDVFRGTDETACGTRIGELVIAWADKYHKDAAPGSIKTIVYGNTDSTSQKTRFEYLQATIAADPRFEILEAVAMQDSTAAAQSTTENMFAKYDQIDCIATPGGEYAKGVLAYTLSEASPVKDPTAMCVVATEMDAELASYIRDGYLFGCVMNGGAIEGNLQTQVEQMDKLLHDEPVDHYSPVDMAMITAENLDETGY
ncbi:MAG: substrate-binding domain-containing protein [Oscillospiraceae bacterium]|nr:substrate-binding domain-containing protein [Oscillospiraceae bacterium]